jgi:hypothetical protein
VNYEFPSRLGAPLVYTVRNDVTMQRPDKLRIITPGDGPASDLYYSSQQMMAYSPGPNLAAVADEPPTIDKAMTAAYENAGIYYPFTDLILTDPYAALTHGAVLAFYIDQSDEVGDTKTDMVAWANDDVFIQMWIGAKDKLPYRIRAIYRKDPLQLRHDMVLSNWRINPVLAPSVFKSTKGLSAKLIPFANPGSEPPPVGTPLFITPSSPLGRRVRNRSRSERICAMKKVRALTTMLMTGTKNCIQHVTAGLLNSISFKRRSSIKTSIYCPSRFVIIIRFTSCSLDHADY